MEEYNIYSLVNDINYIIMMNLNPEDLVNFCLVSNKYINICNSEIFWNNYVHSDKFVMYVPKDYINVKKIIQTNSSWKEIFYNTYKLNNLLFLYDNESTNEVEKNIKLFIYNLVLNNKLDTLLPYMIDNSYSFMASSIIEVGLLLNNSIILDYLYNNLQEYNIIQLMSYYGTPGSYDYMVYVKNMNFNKMFITYLIISGNIILFKHIINDKTKTSDDLLTAAISNANIEITDYSLKLNPKLNPSNGANVIYNKIMSNLLGSSVNKNKIEAMLEYLIKNNIYGNNYSFTLYAIKNHNLDMLYHIYNNYDTYKLILNKKEIVDIIKKDDVLNKFFNKYIF